MIKKSTLRLSFSLTKCPFTASLLAGSCLSFGLFAQQAKPEKTSSSQPDDTVELSEFVVTGGPSNEYYSANSTTATRTDVPIKNTPISIEVISRQFIEDINAV